MLRLHLCQELIPSSSEGPQRFPAQRVLFEEAQKLGVVGQPQQSNLEKLGQNPGGLLGLFTQLI